MSNRVMVVVAGLTLVATVVLGVLVTLAGADSPPAVDLWWNQVMFDARSDRLVGFGKVMNTLGGGFIGVVIVPLLIVGTLLLIRQFRPAVFALCAFAGSAVVVQALKFIFHRARPQDILVVADPGSFPSGHTANAATVALVFWILFPRLWIAIVGSLWTIAMALSRTVVAAHWASDVLGGALVGVGVTLVAWLILAQWVRAAPMGPPQAKPLGASG